MSIWDYNIAAFIAPLMSSSTRRIRSTMCACHSTAIITTGRWWAASAVSHLNVSIIGVAVALTYILHAGSGGNIAITVAIHTATATVIVAAATARNVVSACAAVINVRTVLSVLRHPSRKGEMPCKMSLA